MTLICFILTKTNVFFETVNKGLHYINEWFITNKLFLNTAKIKHLFLHRQSTRDGIPLNLPVTTFNSIEKT